MGRTLDEDAVLKEIGRWIGYLDEDMIERIEIGIKKLPEAQQWIPCSEKLPEEDGQYLITVKYVHVDGYVDIYAEHGDWADGKWDMFCFGHCGEVESILAWMPLPDPWEGEEHDS